jgi:DNA recombination-dependent growth factor C
MGKSRDGYQVCIGADGDVIEVDALTEAQAKDVLCRLIDKLESIETSHNRFHYQFKEWRNVKAPRK